MLYLIIFTLLGVASVREYLQYREGLRQQLAFDEERQAWSAERRELLNRIQAPQAAQVVAWNEQVGTTQPHLTEAEQIQRKAEEGGYSVDSLRVPELWMGSNY